MTHWTAPRVLWAGVRLGLRSCAGARGRGWGCSGGQWGFTNKVCAEKQPLLGEETRPRSLKLSGNHKLLEVKEGLLMSLALGPSKEESRLLAPLWGSLTVNFVIEPCPDCPALGVQVSSAAAGWVEGTITSVPTPRDVLGMESWCPTPDPTPLLCLSRGGRAALSPSAGLALLGLLAGCAAALGSDHTSGCEVHYGVSGAALTGFPKQARRSPAAARFITASPCCRHGQSCSLPLTARAMNYIIFS